MKLSGCTGHPGTHTIGMYRRTVHSQSYLGASLNTVAAPALSHVNNPVRARFRRRYGTKFKRVIQLGTEWSGYRHGVHRQPDGGDRYFDPHRPQLFRTPVGQVCQGRLFHYSIETIFSGVRRC